MDSYTTVYQDNTTINPSEVKLLLGPSILGAILGSILIVVAIIGNVATIIVITRTKSLQKPIYLQVATLAANDLLASLMSTVFIHTYIKQEWTLGTTWCKVVIMMKGINFTISFLHTAYLTLVRYLAVVHSSRGQFLQSWRSTVIATALIWLIPIMLSFVIRFAVHSTAFSTATRFKFNPLLMSCQQHSPDLSIYALMWALLGFFLFGALYFFYCYCHIYVVFRKSRIAIQDHLVHASQLARRKEEISLVKIMCSITLLFLVSFLTTPVVSILTRSDIHLSQYAYVTATQTLHLSPTFNWIIYGISKKSFRVAFTRLMICKWSIPVHSDQGIVLEVIHP